MRKKVFFKKNHRVVPQPRYPHLTELNAVRAGDSAFKIRVPEYNNPYTDAPLKAAWIRGYKRAERNFYAALRRSQQVLSTIGFEEVEA